MERSNPCIALIGMNRTGKTAITRKFLEDFLKKNPDFDLVISDPQGKLSDLTDNIIYDVSDLEQYREYKNTVFVFDEHRILFPSDSRNNTLMYMLSKRDSHANNNIYIFTLHSFDLLQNFLYFYINMYFVFTTKGNQQKIYSKSGCAEELERAVKEVNAVGRGKYPNFNYVVIDTDLETYKKTF